MLSDEIKPINFATFDQEPWDVYVLRVGIPENEAIRQFYRQVVYDHFEHHNEHYPEFEIDGYTYTIISRTVAFVRDEVRFFDNKPLIDMWGQQFDQFEAQNYEYSIFQAMVQSKTPPFPPILIDSTRLVDKGWRTYGRPIHLVEGTHRTSYLLRMAERAMIDWQSEHEFVLLEPK